MSTSPTMPTGAEAAAPDHPPTESEIRATIAARMIDWPADRPQQQIADGIGGLSDFMLGPAYAILECPDPRDQDDMTRGDIWGTDLRPSEAIRLRELAREACARALERCIAVTTDELVAAALAFAAEFPDAPRARIPEADAPA